MRHYETIYIVNPDLSEKDYQDIIKKFSDLIDREKGVKVKIQEWGKQRLAYLLKKFNTGSYVLMEYCGEPGITKELEREFKLDDRVLKFQTVKLADKVDPQKLINEQVEAKEEIEKEEESAPEKEDTVQNEEVKPVEGVNNGF